MRDLIIAIGLLLFIEGLVIAIFPSRIKNMVKIIERTKNKNLRFTGLLCLSVGFIIVWFMKI